MPTLANLWRKKPSSPSAMACSFPISPDANQLTYGGHLSPGQNGPSCSLELAPLSIVELFQTQGCASCPPAIPLVHNATMNPNFLLLTYNVTYFDHIGWKDTFGSPVWDNRQKAYNTKWQRNNVFTPQLIVNGALDGNPASAEDIHQLYHQASDRLRSMGRSVNLDVMNGQVRVYSSVPSYEETGMMNQMAQPPMTLSESYELIIARYDPESVTIKPKAGENKGKKIVHKNTVKELIKVADWDGGDVTVELPTNAGGLERVLFLQGVGGGPILAAVKL
jgi:hypothetical protein